MKVRDPNELKYNRKFELLKNSFNNLKIILNPNLNDCRKKFLNKIIEIISSQIKIYINLLISNHSKNVYDLLNINNQNLSKEITFLYDNFYKYYTINNDEMKKTDFNFYSNKTNKQNKNKKNIKLKNELFNDFDNYDINEEKLMEMDLMEEPQPQIYSKLNLDSNILNNNSFSLSYELKENNKNNIDIKDEIKVVKKLNNKNKNKKDIKIRDNNGLHMNNNSCFYFTTDSNLSSVKEDKDIINIKNDNSSELDYNTKNENINKKEEKKDFENLNLKENNNNYIYPYIKIRGRNKNKKINLKEIYKPLDKSGNIYNDYIKNNQKKQKYISKELINKIKSDFSEEENQIQNNYNKTEINNNENKLIKNQTNNKKLINDFLVPCKSPYGEDLFLLKSENILINKTQKEILENYLEDYFSLKINSKQFLNNNNNNNTINKRIFSPKISSLYKRKTKNTLSHNNNNKLTQSAFISHSLDKENYLLNCLPSSLKTPFDLIINKIKTSKINNSIIKDIEKYGKENYKKINTLYKTSTNFRSPNDLSNKPY